MSLPNIPSEETERPWDSGWDDERWNQYRIVLRTLAESDEKTRTLIEYRLEEPPLSTREIAEKLGINPAAVRMRISRFYAEVRKKYRERQEVP